MRKARSDSRQKIIRGAQDLLCRQGYRGTGLAQIIEESGSPRGSTYFLFPGGKEEIATEALAASGVEFDAMIRAARESSPTAAAWVQTMTEYFAGSLRDSGFTQGCPVSTVTLDSAPGSPALTAACRSAYDRWLSALADGLTGYGVADEAAADLAVVMLTGLEGAMLLCRARQSTEPLHQVARYALRAIEAELP
ncbi:TetR/AcrR family transcriptional regulator [Amycolatopsis nigrescens]|uniref:TetR/AcrR family transcriptional regulator n=1 Tax=Amycolatopsis nigrescens TaxID=381445 RepID=UPI00037960FF|nr:TetR family transcriptional regulator [Amycolatopsis nigrescens]